MNWFKVKIRPADRLMSQYVRKRDKMLCQYNFKCYKGTEGNQTSHFQKRSKEAVRYDPENCDWACAKCHYFIENDPIGQKTLEEWKKKHLGEDGYKKLILRANSYQRRDDKLAQLFVKQLINELK